MATTDAEQESWFVDTNILVYASEPTAPLHAQAQQFLASAWERGARLVVSPQVLREYLSVASRWAQNEMGSRLDAALSNVRDLLQSLDVVEEGASTVERMVDLLRETPVYGKRIHDAQIVATMLIHGLSRLLTNNPADFARFGHLISIHTLETK